MGNGECTACGKWGKMDRAHIRTRGAGAGWEPWEYLLLCRTHHIAQGGMGWSRFIEKYPHIAGELEKRGWEIVDVFGTPKLRRRGTPG